MEKTHTLYNILQKIINEEKVRTATGPVRLVKMSDLKINRTPVITHLDLRKCSIDSQGVEEIVYGLKKNTTLKTLIMGTWWYLHRRGINLLINALKTNNTLTTLDISSYYMDQKGINMIADMLKVNKSLETIHILVSAIHCGDVKNIDSIIDALKTNTTLTYMYFGGKDNFMDPYKIKTLKEMLKRNREIKRKRKELSMTLYMIRKRKRKDGDPIWKAIPLGIVNMIIDGVIKSLYM